MHETGVAQRSPGDEDGRPAQLVIDHLPRVEQAYGIGLGLAPDGHTHDKLVVCVARLVSGDELGIVDGPNRVSAQKL
jgi:hypothetical protein